MLKTREAHAINNAPETQDQAQDLTTRLERVEQALTRLAPVPQPKGKPQSYADVTRQRPTKSLDTKPPVKKSQPTNQATSETTKVIVRLTNSQEKNRINKLSTREIIETVNKQYNNIKEKKYIIVTKKLSSREIVLYVDSTESHTRLQNDTIWTKTLSSLVQVKSRTYEVLLKSVQIETN